MLLEQAAECIIYPILADVLVQRIQREADLCARGRTIRWPEAMAEPRGARRRILPAWGGGTGADARGRESPRRPASRSRFRGHVSNPAPPSTAAGATCIPHHPRATAWATTANTRSRSCGPLPWIEQGESLAVHNRRGLRCTPILRRDARSTSDSCMGTDQTAVCSDRAKLDTLAIMRPRFPVCPG